MEREVQVVRWSRYAYAFLAWAFVVGVLAQVLFIGMGLPLLGRQPSMVELHRNVGWIVHVLPIGVLVFAYLSRAGARHWQWALVLAVIVFIVPILVGLRDSSPILAALHPVLAMVSFAIGVIVALESVRAMRRPEPLAT
jgi:hypothetical protein